jgi:hypothetical protein
LDIERENSSKVTVIQEDPTLSVERALAKAYTTDLENGRINFSGGNDILFCSTAFYLLNEEVYQVKGKCWESGAVEYE